MSAGKLKTRVKIRKLVEVDIDIIKKRTLKELLPWRSHHKNLVKMSAQIQEKKLGRSKAKASVKLAARRLIGAANRTV